MHPYFLNSEFWLPFACRRVVNGTSRNATCHAHSWRRQHRDFTLHLDKQGSRLSNPLPMACSLAQHKRYCDVTVLSQGIDNQALFSLIACYGNIQGYMDSHP